MKIELRKYQLTDIDEIVSIFKESILGTCNNDYNELQIDAWLSGVDKEKWNEVVLNHYSLVALCCGKIVGYGDISKEEYINHLYVLPLYQNKGIATLIVDELERISNCQITVDASITALPFFINRGYKIIKKQTVYRRGVALTNYKMKK